MKTNPPLLALATGAFGIGVTEFAPMGLLPLIAADLGVSIPTAGSKTPVTVLLALSKSALALSAF